MNTIVIFLKKALMLAALVCAGALSCAAQQGAAPEFSSRRLLNDLQVTVAHTKQFGSSMTMGLVIRYGAAFDPDGKGGLTGIVTRMLMKVAADRSEQDIKA